MRNGSSPSTRATFDARCDAKACATSLTVFGANWACTQPRPDTPPGNAHHRSHLVPIFGVRASDTHVAGQELAPPKSIDVVAATRGFFFHHALSCNESRRNPLG